jgi:hypothetical protein
MTDYTDDGAVGRYLGQTLTGAQAVQVLTVLAPAATAWIDSHTGRSWQTPAIPDDAELPTVLGERVQVVAGQARLQRVPVAAILAVRARSLTPGAAVTTLTAGRDYELLDTATGLLLVNRYGYSTSAWSGVDEYLTVDYTVLAVGASTIPAAVQLAATTLAAVALLPTITPEMQAGAIQSISLAGGDISLTYADWQQTGQVPPQVEQWLAAYRRQPVVIA